MLNNWLVWAAVSLTAAIIVALSTPLGAATLSAQGGDKVVGDGPGVHKSTAWNQEGQTGQGVKVGIIDGGFEGITKLLGTELPGSIMARCYDDAGGFTTSLADCETGGTHGTVVAESLADIAPDVSLYIATPESQGDLQQAAEWMVGEGVEVINYSADWPWDGPGNGKSPYSFSPLNTVDRAVAGGAVWVNAASNVAETTWFGPPSFHDGETVGFLLFSPFDISSDIDLLEEQTIEVQLRWDDRWGGATRDLDLLLFDAETNQIVASSTNYQTGEAGHIPFETFSYTPPSAGIYEIVVARNGTPTPGWVQLNEFSGVGQIEHHTSTGSITNPGESANLGMLAVGAAPWHNPLVIEPYSSRGPTPDRRTKPEVVGADCGATATRANDPYPEFCGTSQASPHVAGMAALVRQRFPELGPVEVAEYLKDHAVQREQPDPNNTWGYGFAVLPPIVACSNNPGLEADCAALLAARDTLAGTGTLNWSADVPIEDWDGVTLGGSPLRVTELRLPEKGLTGEIPAGLGSLTRLEGLYLRDNQLSGTIPTQLGSLTNLKELSLTRNQLSGEIPAELAGLTMLERLALGGNQLTGTIPTWLGSLANLEGLYLWGNELNGTIPSELGILVNLQKLWLSENQLSGGIPAELGSLANLEELWLSENQLTGAIPAEIGKLSSLVELVLWGNELSGAIPAELAGLTGLEILSLGGNQLTGTIPTWLGSLTSMEGLYLSDNQLSGTIPTQLGSLTNLQKLWLSENQLSGAIPAEIGDLSSLVELVLWGNELSGVIPAELAGLTSLEVLDLGGNQLTGTIPTWLGSLASLEGLYLSDNQLSGAIPAELAGLTSLEILSLGGNQLTGTIPTWLGSLANLGELYLGDNQLTGEIPSELGRLMNLMVLHLSGNQLTGCVPASLQDVADNDFSELGLSFCASGNSLADLITRYDTNDNGVIERSELAQVINDYYFGEGEQALSKSDLTKLMNFYYFGQ